MTVKIIDRQNHETHYTYFVPGYSTANANTNVNCLWDGCNGQLFGLDARYGNNRARAFRFF